MPIKNKNQASQPGSHNLLFLIFLPAERQGFEPWEQLPVHRISSAARSTTPASFLVFGCKSNGFWDKLYLFCRFFSAWRPICRLLLEVFPYLWHEILNTTVYEKIILYACDCPVLRGHHAACPGTTAPMGRKGRCQHDKD